MEHYEVGVGIECRFLNSGLNDTYLLNTSSGKYILRIYKTDWRTKEEILNEMELLNHLQGEEIPISVPIANKEGELMIDIDAPEGKRFMVLFSYADGVIFGTEENSAIYGREVAKMHNAMDRFKSSNKRFEIDLDHLLDQPMNCIRNCSEVDKEDLIYLESVSAILKKSIEKIKEKLEWGYCHGDLHGGNVHFSDNGTLTHFDFDCGGMGWRAYDLAVFQWIQVRRNEKDNFHSLHWEIFLKSYIDQRAISEIDIQAIPVFVAIREIWLMGLHTGNSHIWGSLWQNQSYFRKNIQFIRRWCQFHTLEVVSNS